MSSRRQLALIHSQTKHFRYRLELAHDVISLALKEPRCASWYVAMSGGKDSTVVHDLLAGRVPSVCYAQRWMLPETEAYLRSISGLHVVCSRDVEDRDYDDPRWYSEAQARDKWPECTWLAETCPACDIGLSGYGRPEQGVFMGLRAAESRGRAMNTWQRGELYQVRRGGWRCNPISQWSTLDVWAYIYSQGLPYNAAYDVMERIGIPLERQRIAELIGSALTIGAAVAIKRGWPDVWNRLAAERPEVRQYA